MNGFKLNKYINLLGIISFFFVIFSIFCLFMPFISVKDAQNNQIISKLSAFEISFGISNNAMVNKSGWLITLFIFTASLILSNLFVSLNVIIKRHFNKFSLLLFALIVFSTIVGILYIAIIPKAFVAINPSFDGESFNITYSIFGYLAIFSLIISLAFTLIGIIIYATIYEYKK